MVQTIEDSIWEEFNQEIAKVKDFDISKLKLTPEDNNTLDLFFKKFLDPKEDFPHGSLHNTIEKNFAIYIVKNNIDVETLKVAYASKGFSINSLTSQIKGVLNGTYGEEPHISIGELVNWCKLNRPDLVELFKTDEFDKVENPYNKLHYSVDHLPYYHQFSSLVGLYGRHYIPVIKARWYQLHGGIIQKVFRLGSLTGDTRLNVAYPLVTEGGKNDLIYAIKTLIEKGISKNTGEKFSMAEPISFHPEALVGKRVERRIDNPSFLSGEVRSPKKILEKVENRGHFDKDFLDFDECTELIISDSPDNRTAREYLSKAENTLGRNKVEKRSVDDLPHEAISYYPSCTNSYFFQPFEFIPESAILQGFMRRKLIPVGNISLFLNHADERLFNEKLETVSFSEESYQNELLNHLQTVRDQTTVRDFTFTEEAQKMIQEYSLYLSHQGKNHSEKISNYCKLTKYTTLTNLVKMSCIIAGAYYQNVVNENHVALAFMDLTELLQNTFDFICSKVRGDFSYGTSWGGANWKEKQCLIYLYKKKAFSKETSCVSIDEFKKLCEDVFSVKESQSHNKYTDMKSKGLIDSSQIGKNGSAVWLKITPKDHKEYLEGLKGSKGYDAYNSVFLTKNQILEGCNPYNPYTPKTTK